MAYNEHLVDRIRQILNERKISASEKRMFGGMCFMVDDKMCLGVHQEIIMARVGPDLQPLALQRAGATPMDFTGRPMKGFVNIIVEGYDMDADLEYWVDLCLQYNPVAKASKKRKSKKKS